MFVIEQPIPPVPAADSEANELKSMFEKQARVERFDLIQTFHACKEKEGKPVGAYIIKMKDYVEQLERLGYVLPQDLSVGLILNGLTSDFARFVRNYNMHNMGKIIGGIHALLIKCEKVMCYGDTISVKVIQKPLDEFSACSVLLSIFSKSIVFFGSMKEEEKNAIRTVRPFAIGKLPLRYLGVLLIAKRLGVKECGYLLDKIKCKISNWKNRYLSYARRLQLIDVVLESINVYWASVFLLPTTIIKEINRLLKNFLWNQVKRQMVHTVKLRGMSIWKVSLENEDSWGWKNLLSIRDIIKPNVIYRIGNGINTSLWLNADLKVKDMIGNEDWLWPRDCEMVEIGLVLLVFCSFSKEIWTKSMKMAKIEGKMTDWNHIIQNLIDVGNGSNISSVVRRLFLAANVYYIWTERNRRIFIDEKRSEDEVYKSIIKMVKNRLFGLLVKDNQSVRKMGSKWMVSCKRYCEIKPAEHSS
uniref:RNA-directed DNA polymerase, eukaryota, reverse transcriptase zinc-binding domain protein n=1 Tax=Tanacetum cinerariifolium TaxID=118510 RepID=A0A6L2MRJ9_TANCI|nr:hypothetical protein [Tanacetum cinerariifolium]